MAERPTLKPIDDGSRLLTRGVAHPRSGSGERPSPVEIVAAIGGTLKELAERCPKGHHIKRVTVKRDAARDGKIRGWRYHCTIIFEKDPPSLNPIRG